MTDTMPARRIFTPDESLFIERRAAFKSGEYLDGEMFAVSGVTPPTNAHGTLMELGQAIERQGDHTLGSDMR